MSGLSNSAMLIELNISVWTGRKQDKKVSAEIDVRKHAKVKAGNYHKNLLAGSGELERVGQIAAKVRNWHYSQTLPWSDGGARLLPTNNFFEYKEQLNAYEKEFEEAVDKFVEAYPSMVEKAAFTLGELFDRSEYPRMEHVRQKFGFNYVFLPLPEAGDFRVDVEESVQAELREQYQDAYQQKIESAMKDAWDRLYQCLAHLADRLGESDGKPNIFRDSLIPNAMELADLLTNLNITGDTKLEQARNELKKALLGVEIGELRKNPAIRSDVKARVEEILKKFN